MGEKKLTDEEIVKAIDKCFANPMKCEDGCPYFNKNGRNFCVEDKRLYHDLKDLIHRLQDENIQLKGFVSGLEDEKKVESIIFGLKETIAEQKAEIERLTEVMNDFRQEVITLNNEKLELQKQIEEIAKELCPHYDNGNCYYEVTEVCECCFGCEFCWAISQVLNAGYRKIPEGAVVLMGTETEQRFEDLMVAFDEMGFMPNTTHPFPEEYVETWKQRLIFVFGQLRKATAEKFAERVKMAFYYEFDELIPSIMADKIDEICKEITEGKV